MKEKLTLDLENKERSSADREVSTQIKSSLSCKMGRSPCCAKEGLNRGAWTAMEDKILKDYINAHGEGRWRNLPKRAGLNRCGKSCRLRWLNYLRPDIKRGNISADEEEVIIRLHKLLGNRWSLIAGRLPGRTDNEIKNYWNTNLGKKLKGQQNSTTTDSKHYQAVKKSEAQTAPSQVVRTRAIRCSKVFINPYPKTVDPSDDGGSNLPNTSMNGDATPQVLNQTSASPPINGVSLSENSQDQIIEHDHQNQSEPMLDFNSNVMGGEFNLSDLLNFDFNDPNYDQSSNASSPTSDQPLVFSEEMVQDWTSNLHSLASCLDCGDQEWLT